MKDCSQPRKFVEKKFYFSKKKKKNEVILIYEIGKQQGPILVAQGTVFSILHNLYGEECK